MEEEDKTSESSVVAAMVIKKVFETLRIKQPKESIPHVQRVIKIVMDDFIGRLAEIKEYDKNKKITKEDIKDLIERDEIEYLKGGK